ncbi:MAG: transglycosylase domain-containing protein [Thermaerobacter sp.]|nr:transglycosylase domain-containing protein [Thermaerobacter sp.]
MVLLGAGAVVVLTLGVVGKSVVAAWRTMPTISKVVAATAQDSIVYDRYGQQVEVLHGPSNRMTVSSLGQVSTPMQDAIVAIEDHSFYSNPGFDLKSMARAAIADVLHRGGLQGASTITEQLAKTLYLKDNQSLTYKLQEVFLGLELARMYSKQQILTMYLNNIYFGDGATGIAAAANAYYNENPSQLTLAQASVIAGLVQAPSLYDPYVNPKLAKARQLQVLQAMETYQGLSHKAAMAAYNAPLNLHQGTIQQQSADPYPWYTTTIISLLEGAPYHLTYQQITQGGLHIYTALDPKVYNISQNAVTYWMNHNFGTSTKAVPFHQAAAVVMDPQNGYVLSIIGGRNPSQAVAFDENYAFQAHRSTGSSIKPIMEYTPALAKGLTQMTVMQDIPQFRRNGNWWPQNDNHLNVGYITLRDALGISDNNIAVRLLNKIGLNYGFNFANQKFGLTLNPANLTQSGLAMAIGGFLHGPTPMQMTDAYDAIANGGVRMKPIFITKVTNQYGAVLFQNRPSGQREFSPQVAYIMTQMMERVFYPGPLPGLSTDTGMGQYTTGYNLSPGRPAAGKTGTNNGYADAWFDGFTPQLLSVVWEGRQAEEPNVPQYLINGQGPAYGAAAAGPIWRQIIQQSSAALNLPAVNFTKPSGIVYVPDVSITSGQLAGPYTPQHDIQGADFIAGTQPTTVGHSHVMEPVLVSNPHLLWQPGCGPFVDKVFLTKEPNWRPGMPLPLDHFLWAPTATCTPSSATGSGTGTGTTAPGNGTTGNGTTGNGTSTGNGTPPGNGTGNSTG